VGNGGRAGAGRSEAPTAVTDPHSLYYLHVGLLSVVRLVDGGGARRTSSYSAGATGGPVAG